MSGLPYPVRALLAHVVGYFRWTQTVPMLLAWGIVWTILAAFLLVNFQAEAFSIFEWLERFAERYPRLAASLPEVGPLGQQREDGSVTFDEGDVRRVVLAYWGLVSALLYLGALSIERVLGPRPPRSWTSRLRRVGLLTLATFGAFLLTYVFSKETFHDGPGAWLLVFTALSLLPLPISAYSITIGMACDAIVAALNGADSAGAVPEGPDEVH